MTGSPDTPTTGMHAVYPNAGCAPPYVFYRLRVRATGALLHHTRQQRLPRRPAVPATFVRADVRVAGAACRIRGVRRCALCLGSAGIDFVCATSAARHVQSRRTAAAVMHWRDHCIRCAHRRVARDCRALVNRHRLSGERDTGCAQNQGKNQMLEHGTLPVWRQRFADAYILPRLTRAGRRPPMFAAKRPHYTARGEHRAFRVVGGLVR